MTLKLVLLKSGEDIIADVQEMIIADPEDPENRQKQKVVGYFFNKPCLVKLKTTEENSQAFQISLFPWIPLSKNPKIPVINDWIVTLVDPIDKLKEMYERDVLKNESEDNQVTDLDEQSDLGLTD